MTPEQRIAQLEAELVEERAERRRLTETLRVMAESQARVQAEQAASKAARSARNARQYVKTSSQTPIQSTSKTSIQTSETPPSPSSPLPSSFPPSPAPSSPYPLSFPPSSPPPQKALAPVQAVLCEQQLTAAPEALMAAWNQHAPPELPRCRELTDKRRKHARVRLGERPVAQWVDIIQRMGRSRFLRGLSSGRTWVATFDWLISSPDPGAKVLEGQYDDKGSATARNGTTYEEGSVSLS